MAMHKEEVHTAKVSTIIVALVFICWAPYFSASLYTKLNVYEEFRK
jgi:hypothetical protein